MGRRRRAREEVLKLLYESEVGGRPLQDVISDFLEGSTLDDDIKQFVDAIVRLVDRYIREIDEQVERVVVNWPMDRLAVVDKCILRSAIAEMLYFKDTPVKVVIDEAVSIAKKFSTADSGRFVNGVLDRIAREEGLL